MTARLDLADQRFGRLVVIALAHINGGQSQWRCVCDCGNECVVKGSHLRSGHTTSCGCAVVRHGDAGNNADIKPSSVYVIWKMMGQRCRNPKATGFKYYGGRGIAICDRWRDSFKTFRDDMGPRPSPNHTVDRIDGERGYEPSNCRWATWKEQRSNQAKQKDSS